jgi:hypothetical protein
MAERRVPFAASPSISSPNPHQWRFDVPMFKRFARATVLATALIALTAGATFAHECFNASRSEQGNAGAANSGNWATESVAELFGVIHFFEIPGVETALTPAQQEVAFETATEMGVPSNVTIFVGKITIGANGNAFTDGGKAADGKGIDHFFAAYGEQLVAAYFAGLASGS